MFIISSLEAGRLLHAKGEFTSSLDLGISTVKLNVERGIVHFPDGQEVPMDDLKKPAKENCCYLVEENQLKKIALFSDETQRLYKLLPTLSAPTIEISGIRMHRTSERNPWEDTEDKIGSIKPRGIVLDTCTGLGYTAILASKTADEVITVEIDPNVRTIASYNPWSNELFTSQKIKSLMGDIEEVTPTFPDRKFDAVIHDPPSFKIAGELYSLKFYRELYRILKPGGKLFHYTGRPGGNTNNQDLGLSVMKRLKEAGFINIIRYDAALGIVAMR